MVYCSLTPYYAHIQATHCADLNHVADNPVSNIEQKLFSRSEKFADRITQQIKTHAFPTSSIGSFPQTPSIRKARLAHKKGQLSNADYETEVNEYMTYAIKEQERIGVDVLVHGEPERSDM